MQRILTALETHTKEKAAKKARKQARLTACNLELQNLLQQYSDQKEVIEAWRKANIPEDLPKTAVLDALESNLATLTRQLAAHHYTVTQRKGEEKREADRQAMLEAAMQRAKAIKILKDKLSAECQTPNDLSTHPLWTFPKDEILPSPEEARASWKKNTETYILEAYIAFYTEAREYILAQRHILLAIDAIAAVSDEQLLQEKINAFKQKALVHIEKIRYILNAFEQKKNWFQLFNQADREMSFHEGLLCSPSDDETGIQNDKLIVNQEGRYCSERYADRRPFRPEGAEEKKDELIFKANETTPHPDNLKRYQAFKESRLAILKKIAAIPHVKDDEKEDKSSPPFVELIKTHETLAKDLRKMQQDHDECLKKKNEIQSRQKLNKNNPDHLNHWEARTEHCWHGFGGTPITVKEGTYRVPARIYKMMNVIQTDHLSTAHFLADFHQARKSASWNLFFSISCIAETYRGVGAEKLYNADDIDLEREPHIQAEFH